MKKIVIINGSGGVGKDTFVDFCDDIIECVRVSSVDKIKEVALKLGWDGKSKSEKDRKFLSDLKLLSMEYSDHPYQYMKESVTWFHEHPNFEILFLMIREPGEIKRLKEEFGALTLLIKNDNVATITSNMADENVNNFEYDFIVDNSRSLEDLRNRVWEFVNALREV